MTDMMVPYQDIKAMASAMSFGKMFGKSADELLPLMILAQAEGKHPAIAAMEYDVIQGRPALNSRSALARFQSAGGKIQWQKRDDSEASATFAHPQGGELTVTWTIKRAAQAGLSVKDNWKKYPAQMLSARVVAEGVRAVFPACLSGMYTTEEVQDFEAPKKHEAMKSADDQNTQEVQRVVIAEENPLPPPATDPRLATIKALKEAVDPSEATWTGLKRLYRGDLDALIVELERMKLARAAHDLQAELGDNESAKAEDQASLDLDPPAWDGQK